MIGKVLFPIIVGFLVAGIISTGANSGKPTGEAGNSTSRPPPSIYSNDPNKFFKNVMKKYSQVLYLINQMKDCKPLFLEVDKEFTAIYWIPMREKEGQELFSLNKEAVILVQSELEFYEYMPYLSVEEYHDLWEQLGKPTGSNIIQESFAHTLMAIDDVKTFLKHDVKMLDYMWKRLNLHQRLKECRDKLANLASRLAGDTISSTEVMSRLKAKLNSVGDMIIQCNVPSGLLKEIKTTLNDVPEPEAIAEKLKAIRKDFIDYLQKLDLAYISVRKAVRVWGGTGVTETFTYEELSAFETVKEAFALSLVRLKREWDELHVVKRAKECLIEVKALHHGDNRLYERAFEL